MTKPHLDLRTSKDVKFLLLSYQFWMLVKLKLNSTGSENIEQCQILTPLILVSNVYQTQTQLKIANVSDQTHFRHIDRGILPVQYDKAAAGSENIE